MKEFREFTRDIGGIPHTFRLDKEEATRRKLDWDKDQLKAEKPAAATKKTTPANKAAKPADK